MKFPNPRKKRRRKKKKKQEAETRNTTHSMRDEETKITTRETDENRTGLV